jgi:hypothetical protein
MSKEKKSVSSQVKKKAGSAKTRAGKSAAGTKKSLAAKAVKTAASAASKTKKPTRRPRSKMVTAKEMAGAQLRKAITDILGKTPREVTIELGDKLGPGRDRIRADEPSWSGNIYKYRY